MERVLATCDHCLWIDYLDREGLKRCPKCGSGIVVRKNPFAGETVTVTITDYDDAKKKVTYTFEEFEDKCEKFIGNSLDEVFPAPEIRRRIVLMMKAYLWLMVKDAPALWTIMITHVEGLVELMTLKVHEENKIVDMLRRELSIYKAKELKKNV